MDAIKKLIELFRKNPGLWHDSLKGGVGDGKTPADFKEGDLKEGASVELEHVNNPKMATEIAMDHLSESPSYYKDLAEMEGDHELKKTVNVSDRIKHTSMAGLNKSTHEVTYTSPVSQKPSKVGSFTLLSKSDGSCEVEGLDIPPELDNDKTRRLLFLVAHNYQNSKLKKTYAKPLSLMQFLTRKPEIITGELEKGRGGDWQKEGYTLKHKEINRDHLSPGGFGSMRTLIQARDKNGEYAGHLDIETRQNTDGSYESSASEVRVPSAHQRKGIASAMYKLAESKLGHKIRPSEFQSDAGEALWSQPNRSFGKSQINTNGFGYILKKAVDLIANKLEELEKAELPPTKHGELHPTKPYIAKTHSDGQLCWYYIPKVAKEYDDFVAQNKNNYLNSLPEEHREVVGAFMSDVQKGFTRHAVPAKDKKPVKGGVEPPDIPRIRHIRSLLQKDPNCQITIHSPESMSLHVRERHGDSRKSSTFHFSLKKK